MSTVATPLPVVLQRTTKATILIVEDDAGVAGMEKLRLDRAHYRTLIASTADEALHVLRGQPVDLILLDYRLPGGVDGIGFYGELQAAGYDVPVILVTGFANEAVAIGALRAGMRDFVSKSAAYLDYLPEAVERVLNQVRMEKALVESEQKLRQQAQQYLRAQRMESLGTLAGGIAHDLNNVLTPILMAVELLRDRVQDATGQNMLELLQVSGQRAADMVRQVLTFARGLEGTRQVLSLAPLIGEIIKMLQQTFPKSIRLERNVPKDLWPISADVTQMHQVIMNLCVNARDAMPQGGRLTLTARNQVLDEQYARLNPDARPGLFVTLEVEDTGVGIPSANLERIFDPFFTTKPVGQGSGLGLSTVLGIVKNHGGFVRVQSEVGKGSRFAVYVPAAVQACAPHPGQVKAPPGGNGQLILVIDDEASIREIARAILETANYRVLTAADGAQGAALYAEHLTHIDAVLVDLMMPVMDGMATIRALQKLNPNVRLIAASGLMERSKTVDLIGGVREFLPKPFTAEALLRALHVALKEPTFG